jgi:signal transduction histidine kinase
MILELRDVLTIVVILVSAVSILVVSRNARKATSVNSQSVDLARIREQRAEIRETQADLDTCKTQLAELSRKLTVANRDGARAWMELAELKRLAHRPDMTLSRFREYIGPIPVDFPDEIVGYPSDDVGGGS